MSEEAAATPLASMVRLDSLPYSQKPAQGRLTAAGPSVQLPALQHMEQLAGLSLQEQQHHLDRTDTVCYGAINHHDRAIQHKANV